MKTTTIILVFSLLCFTAQAQRICGSVDYTKTLITADPSVAQSVSNAEQQITAFIKRSNNARQRDTGSNEIIRIPVVIHVIYKAAAENISDAQVLSQVESLNRDFSLENDDRVNTPAAFSSLAADVRIRFCLAQVDPKGKKTNGIVRKQTNLDVFTADDAMKSSLRGGDDPWDCTKYLNIWVCNLGGRILGYATLPGGPIDRDGVVIGFDVFGTVGNVRSPFNKGRTTTHEIGHWLGLKHLWGDDDCGDDGVDDTPKQKTYNFGCPSFPNITECSQTANGDLFMNYMDFSDDACMNMFSNGQKKRMRALFAEGNIRNSFLESFACDSNLVQAGPLPDTLTSLLKKDVFKIYPNPVQSVLTVNYKPAESLQVKSFSIYNVVGMKVFSGQLTKEITSFNVAHLAPGIYVIRIDGKNGHFSTKIFKQ